MATGPRARERNGHRRSAHRAPKPVAKRFVERFISSIRRECLDHAIVPGEKHLRRTLHNYFEHYQKSRTHLSLGKDAPSTRAAGGAWDCCGNSASWWPASSLRTGVPHSRRHLSAAFRLSSPVASLRPIRVENHGPRTDQVMDSEAISRTIPFITAFWRSTGGVAAIAFLTIKDLFVKQSCKCREAL